ncbi:hypothetical protein KC221_20965, partial [Mycobacterium tuberculosis]|nr:hypothetical protein [Mycobacterium tuberculosis]
DTDAAEDEKVKDSKWQQSLLFIRRNAISLMLLIGISIYLTLNFQQKLKQQSYEVAVNEIVKQSIANQPNYVVSISYDVADKTAKPSTSDITKPYLIRVLLQGLTPPKYSDIHLMEQKVIALTKKRFPSRPPAKLQV